MKNILFVDGKISFFSQCAHTCVENGHNVYFIVSTFERQKSLMQNGHQDHNVFLLPKLMKDTPSENSCAANEEIDNAMEFMKAYSDLPSSFYDKTFYSYMHLTINCIARIIEEHNIDIAVMFNYLLYPLPLVKVYCEKKGLKMVFFENGYFRPNTLSVDVKGLNFENSVPRDPSFYITEYSCGKAEQVSETDLKTTDRIYRDLSFAARMWYKLSFWIHSLFSYEYRLCRFTQSIGAGIIRDFRKKRIKTFQKPDKLQLDNPYYFIPFQVERDSQILSFSPHIKNMDQLVSNLVAAFTRLKKKNEFQDIHLIFKEHPEDQGVVDHTNIYESYAQLPWVHFMRSYDTQELIQKAEGIITINSTVAIESLIQNKKVLTLGNAFFNIEGLVRHAENPDNLEQDLIAFRDFLPDKKLTEQFLHYLRHSYNITGTWKNPSGSDVVCAAARVMKEAGCE